MNNIAKIIRDVGELAATEDRKVIECSSVALLSWADEVDKLQDTANLWQCMQEAGIDNVEAYSQGYRLYYERYPEKDEWA